MMNPCHLASTQWTLLDTPNLWVGMCEVMDNQQFGTDKTIMLDTNAGSRLFY